MCAIAFGVLACQTTPPRARPADVSTVIAAAPTLLPPTSVPTAAPVARIAVAFAEPGGTILGAIPQPAAAQACYSGDWAEVTWQNGRVWVRLSDAPGLEIASLADLAPPTAAPIIVQPPVAPPIGQQAAPAEPTTDRTHERPALERSPAPTPVSPYTIR